MGPTWMYEGRFRNVRTHGAYFLSQMEERNERMPSKSGSEMGFGLVQ